MQKPDISALPLGFLPAVQDDAGGVDAGRGVREREGEERLHLRCDGERLRPDGAVEDGAEPDRRGGKRPSDVGERRLRRWQLSSPRCDWLPQPRALVEQLLRPEAGLGSQEGWEGAEPKFRTGKEILRQD